MLIRFETADDVDAIHRLTEAAFAPMPFSDGLEAGAVDGLRLAGDLTLSLVAIEGSELVGHAAFSPIEIDGQQNGWFGLGPISVKREHQRKGIGRALIQKGLQMLRDRGASGCALIGDPDFYSRVGFSSGRLRYRDLDARLVQHIVLRGDAPAGTIRYAPALEF